MKKFEYYDYRDTCPFAVQVENIVNICASATGHLRDLRREIPDEHKLFEFFMSCLGYWSEYEHYDGRNQLAVLGSRAIAEKFPHIKSISSDEDILKNAYGFTLSAHRYLQQELFNTILEYIKQKDGKIYEWWTMQEFVINNGVLVPYQEYKRMH